MLLFIVNNLLIIGVQYSEHAQTGKVSMLMNHRIDPQVMVFGASNGETGIASNTIEKESGKTVFNMCVDGTSVLQFGDLVREFNEYSRHCEMVVFAIGPFALQKEKLPHAMNRYYAWSHNTYLRQNVFLNQVPEFRKLKYIPFYGFVLYDSDFYKNSFDGWSRILNRPFLTSNKADQGWASMPIQWGDNNSVSALESLSLQVDSSVVNEYKQLTKELNHKGKKVVFVLMPCQDEGRQVMKGYDQLRKGIQSITAYPNTCLDFSEDLISKDKKWFYNYSHLNTTGAVYFSQKLGRRIK